ncbi:hypothetical protein [Amycolatopsis sp. lyj-23]
MTRSPEWDPPGIDFPVRAIERATERADGGVVAVNAGTGREI